MNFFRRIQFRRAQKRLLKALDRCTIDDLRRATALANWLNSTNLLPGDKVTLSFSDHYEIGVDSYKGHCKQTEELIHDLKELEK